MDREGPPGREPSRIDRKSLRHVLYGNNPRSLTRRLQAKLNPRADRIKEETACTRASPTPFSPLHGGPGRGLEILCVPNSDVDLEFWLTLSPRWCSLDFGPHLAPTFDA